MGQFPQGGEYGRFVSLPYHILRSKSKQTNQLNKIALLSIFSTFDAYQTKEWVSPPLLKPWLILEPACSCKWFCLVYSSRLVQIHNFNQPLLKGIIETNRG